MSGYSGYQTNTWAYNEGDFRPSENAAPEAWVPYLRKCVKIHSERVARLEERCMRLERTLEIQRIALGIGLVVAGVIGLVVRFWH